MSDFAARVLIHDTFDGRGFTDQNSLVNALLTKPDQIDPVLTHLMGREDKKFPLSFLSEGYEGSQGIEDIQYTYDVINKIDKADEVVSAPYTAGDTPGVNQTGFFVIFRSNWFRKGHIIESANDVQAIITNDPVPAGGYYKYELQLVYDGRFNFCPLSELVAGTLWAMVGGAPVSESLSGGNSSNFVAPGKMKNQLSILRKSWSIGGNVSNRTVECQFDINGKKTNLWIAFEQWQFMIKWKTAIEEHLWYSRYNRDAQGVVRNIDRASGQVIPIGAGVLDQIPNNDTFGKLTARKIKDTTRDVLFGANDVEKMDVRLFTGYGGGEEFDTAMKDDLRSLGFNMVDQDKFIKGGGYNLVRGGYFTVYEHKDGHRITTHHLPLLDLGTRALKAPRHPHTNLPMTSYEMYFIDMSIYDGKKNLQMFHQKGRAMKTGILQGMSDTPFSFSGNNKVIQLGTDIDASHIHFMCTKGISIRRNTHCFTLKCDIND